MQLNTCVTCSLPVLVQILPLTSLIPVTKRLLRLCLYLNFKKSQIYFSLFTITNNKSHYRGHPLFAVFPSSLPSGGESYDFAIILSKTIIFTMPVSPYLLQLYIKQFPSDFYFNFPGQNQLLWRIYALLHCFSTGCLQS